MSTSYAGTYTLTPLRGEWRLLSVNGRPVGAWRGRGGVYAAAKFFGF